MVIQHNLTAMNAWRQTGVNNKTASKSLEKLSSGFKINRAGDDAAGLAISEKMRGQIRGTMMGTQNVNMGIDLVQTAEGALNETHAILGRMRELAVQSSNGTYQNEVDRANLEKEYQALKSEVDRIAESTHYNGIKLLNGSHKSSSTGWSGLIDFPPDGYVAGTFADAGINADHYDARVNQLLGRGWTIGSLDWHKPGGGEYISFQSDIVLTWNASTSMWDYYSMMKGKQGSSTNFIAQGSFDPLNPISEYVGPTSNPASIVYYGTGSEHAENSFFSIRFYDDQFYIPSEGIENGTMIVLRNNSSGFGGDSYAPYVFVPDPNSEPVVDTKVNKGEIIIQYGANSPDNLKIEISDMRIKALGIDSTSISKIDLANNSIASLDNATNSVSKERANLGAYQNRLESIARDNGVKTENLQAAESSIRDVDMAKEMMAFTKNNILAQAAQSMLAQANQLPQGVLSLLR